MATALLIIIYIALSVWDSGLAFGTAWPAIYSDFGLPFSFRKLCYWIIVSCRNGHIQALSVLK